MISLFCPLFNWVMLRYVTVWVLLHCHKMVARLSRFGNTWLLFCCCATGRHVTTTHHRGRIPPFGHQAMALYLDRVLVGGQTHALLVELGQGRSGHSAGQHGRQLVDFTLLSLGEPMGGEDGAWGRTGDISILSSVHLFNIIMIAPQWLDKLCFFFLYAIYMNSDNTRLTWLTTLKEKGMFIRTKLAASIMITW